MKTRLCILTLFLLTMPHVISAQQDVLISRSTMLSEEKDCIAKQLVDIKKTVGKFSIHEIDNVLYNYIGHFRCSDLELFLKRVVMNNELIEQITLKDSVLTIRYLPEFYQFSIMDAIYMMYNDMYKAYFSYDEISAVSIILTDRTNLTFLPTINSDVWMPMEKALLRKEWFIPDIDYVDFLGASNVEAGRYSNGKSEYSAEKIAAKVTVYRNMIEGN